MESIYAAVGSSLLVATIGVTASGLIVVTTWGLGRMFLFWSLARWIRREGHVVAEALGRSLRTDAGPEKPEWEPEPWKGR